MEEARIEPWSILEWSLHVAEIGMTSRFWETVVLVPGRTHNRKKTIEIMRTTLIFAKKQTSKQRCLFLIASDFNLPVILSSSCWDLCHLCTLSTYKGRYLKKNEFNFFAKGHWCESLLIKKQSTDLNFATLVPSLHFEQDQKYLRLSTRTFRTFRGRVRES